MYLAEQAKTVETERLREQREFQAAQRREDQERADRFRLEDRHDRRRMALLSGLVSVVVAAVVGIGGYALRGLVDAGKADQQTTTDRK